MRGAPPGGRSGTTGFVDPRLLHYARPTRSFIGALIEIGSVNALLIIA
jgi:hypothetical protein